MTLKTPRVAIQIENNILDGSDETAPRFMLKSLQKLFVGTAGSTLELGLYRGQKAERKTIDWVLRSIDSYAVGGNAPRGAKLVSCRVTRSAPGVSSAAIVGCSGLHEYVQ